MIGLWWRFNKTVKAFGPVPGQSFKLTTFDGNIIMPSGECTEKCRSNVYSFRGRKGHFQQEGRSVNRLKEDHEEFT